MPDVAFDTVCLCRSVVAEIFGSEEIISSPVATLLGGVGSADGAVFRVGVARPHMGARSVGFDTELPDWLKVVRILGSVDSLCCAVVLAVDCFGVVFVVGLPLLS